MLFRNHAADAYSTHFLQAAASCRSRLLRRCKPLWFSIAAMLLLLFAPSAGAQGAGGAPALTPQMGWNTWDSFGCGNATETVVRAEALAMHTNGMQAAGYQYINLNDCWMAATRDANGNIQADPNLYPNGIQATIAYVHSLGLKFGIYEDMGTMTCDNDVFTGTAHPGSSGHYQQDANTFVSWGVDYINMDWCSANGTLDPTVVYPQFAQAVTAAIAANNPGHPIYLAICDWGTHQPWTFGRMAGWNSWRATSDMFVPTWTNMIDNIESTGAYFAYGGPGGWNDPDILEVGMGGIEPEGSGDTFNTALALTPYMDQTHFSLWSMVAAPLLAGNDFTLVNSTNTATAAAAQAALATQTNTEVIAVDQDALGKPGILLSDDGSGHQVWARNVVGGTILLLLNGSTNLSGSSTVGGPATITVPWTEIGLPATTTATARDLWAHASLGTFTGSYSATVPAYGVSMVKLNVSTVLPAQAVYEADAGSPAVTLSGGAAVVSCYAAFGYSCLDGNEVSYLCSGASLTFNNVMATSAGTYNMLVYGTANGTYTMNVSVNGGAAVPFTMSSTNWTLAFPVGVQALLKAGSNTIQFTSASGCGANIDHLVVSSPVTTPSAAATPTFSPGTGNYSTPQTVTIADSTTGATIYYTTDGTTPTAGSNVYSGPITVPYTETLQAIATAGGYSQSAVVSAVYTLPPQAATPTFSVAGGVYGTSQTVAIADTTAGATIYYTTNGTTPTTSSAVYTGPITVSSTETLEAFAIATGYSQSYVATAGYTISALAATPVFLPVSGTYTSAQSVALTDSTPGVTFYYTTNGTTPTASSTVYTGPITVSSTETLQAIATASGYLPSAVASAAYTIALPAATPTFSVLGGTYTSVQSVTLADSTPGAKIYYTTNGTTPTTSSTVYTGAITVSSTETLQAIATASGSSSSAVASATYTINLPQPGFSITGTPIAVIAGSSAGNTSFITLTPSNGFTGVVALSCAITPVAASDPATCSIPASVTISGTTAQVTTLSVNTTAVTSASSATKKPSWMAVSAGIFPCILFVAISGRRRRWRRMLGMLVLLFAITCCFSSCSSSNAGLSNNPGTTGGAYTVRVTGTSGAITQTGAVSLSVQ